jgi:hypothetical protein
MDPYEGFTELLHRPKTIHDVERQAKKREDVERLASWLDGVAWQDEAHSHHEYEQAAKALRELLSALDEASKMVKDLTNGDRPAVLMGEF